MKKKQTCKKVVNSDKSGIVASINSSVKLAKTKDRDSTSYNRVTKFSADCVKNVCHLKKWTSVDVYRMVDGLILNQVTIQDTEKLQLDNACFLLSKYPTWIENKMNSMTRTELFLQTLVSIFSPGMVKSYFPFLLSVFLSGQNCGQNNIHWSNV